MTPLRLYVNQSLACEVEADDSITREDAIATAKANLTMRRELAGERVSRWHYVESKAARLLNAVTSVGTSVWSQDVSSVTRGYPIGEVRATRRISHVKLGQECSLDGGATWQPVTAEVRQARGWCTVRTTRRPAGSQSFEGVVASVTAPDLANDARITFTAGTAEFDARVPNERLRLVRGQPVTLTVEGRGDV